MGDYIRIQFVRADGEVVSGEFAYRDWPQEIYANVNAPPGHIDINAQTESRVLEVTGDGDSARVQFTLADGEVVTGKYRRYGWYKAPQREIEEDSAIMGIPLFPILTTITQGEDWALKTSARPTTKTRRAGWRRVHRDRRHVATISQC